MNNISVLAISLFVQCAFGIHCSAATFIHHILLLVENLQEFVPIEEYEEG